MQDKRASLSRGAFPDNFSRLHSFKPGFPHDAAATGQSGHQFRLAGFFSGSDHEVITKGFPGNKSYGCRTDRQGRDGDLCKEKAATRRLLRRL